MTDETRMVKTAVTHPGGSGFTPRYEWRGRERAIVWRHCGEDARSGPKNHVIGKRADYHTVVSCNVCDLRWESRCLWDGVA